MPDDEEPSPIVGAWVGNHEPIWVVLQPGERIVTREELEQFGERDA